MATPHQEGSDEGPVNLEVAGRAVRLEMGAQECPWPVRDGDDIIVAGERQADALVGYAYKDVTQGYVSRASCRADAIQGSLTLLFATGALWLGSIAHSDTPFFLWTQRILLFGLALVFVLFTVVYIISIAEKLQAAFLVLRASLETVRGIARNVQHLPRGERSAARMARIELDGRVVEFVMPRAIAIREGDEIVVTGEQAGDVLAGMAYRNITQSVLGRAWSIAGIVVGPLLIVVSVAMLGGLWSSGGGDLDIWVAIRRALALGIMMGMMFFALDRYFQWRLYLEAYRRVKCT